jgi:hypothetical protein
MNDGVYGNSQVRGSPNLSQILSKCAATERVTEGLFPRSQERDPIEAIDELFSSIGRENATPCAVADNEPEQLDLHLFHVRQSVAPLKQGTKVDGTDRCLRVPA